MLAVPLRLILTHRLAAYCMPTRTHCPTYLVACDRYVSGASALCAQYSVSLPVIFICFVFSVLRMLFAFCLPYIS